MELKVFYSSAQGASHSKKHKECQDWSGSYHDEKCAIAIVCDGHGGDDYVRSGIGSKIACEVAKKDIKCFIDTAKVENLNENSDELLRGLEASIISGWNKSVRQDFEKRPFTDDDLKCVSEKAKAKYRKGEIESAYGTTLIAVAMTKDYWFGLQIGDGKCVAVNRESQFGKPIPKNEKCFLNVTTSICDEDALINFRHRYSQKLPAAIFVGSDGTDDSFSNDEQLYGLYRTIVYSFGTTNFEEAKKDLEEYLPRLSAKGSGDDVSIAAIFDMDAIAELSIVKDFDPEKEKARIAEAERRKAEQREAERREIERRNAERREEEQRKAEQKEAERRIMEAKSAARRQAGSGFCVYCGAELYGGMFCSQCGKKVIKHHIGSEIYDTSNGKNEQEAAAIVVPKAVISEAAVEKAVSRAEEVVITDNTTPGNVVSDNAIMRNVSDVKEAYGQKVSENEISENETAQNKIPEKETAQGEISENELFDKQIPDNISPNNTVSDSTERESKMGQEALSRDLQDSGSNAPDNTVETLKEAAPESKGIAYGD